MSHLKITRHGDKYCYNNEGQLHREDGPAVEFSHGTREDGAAVEFKFWYYNGRLIGRSNKGFAQEDFERYLRSLKIKEYW